MFESKYFKYKNKYNQLKNLEGAAAEHKKKDAGRVFGYGTWRLYIMLDLDGQNEEAALVRRRILDEYAEYNIPNEKVLRPHISLVEIHLSTPKLFKDLDIKGKNFIEAIKSSREYNKLICALNEHIDRVFSNIIGKC